jgi:hypothetical protein
MPSKRNKQIVSYKISRIQTVALIVSIVLYITSLFTVAFCSGDGCRTSLEVLFLGWFATLTGGAGISWLANPLLILSWLLLRKSSSKTWIFALLATVLAILFLNFETIIKDEAGHYEQITNVGLGYWLWLTSCIVILVGSLTKRQTKSQLC